MPVRGLCSGLYFTENITPNKLLMGCSRKDPHEAKGENLCHLEREGAKFFSDNSKCI